MKVRASLILMLAACFPGCAAHHMSPSLLFEQHTLRVPLAVDREGVAQLAQYPPFVGRIDLKPILQAEGKWPIAGEGKALQLLVNYGRFYVAGEGFRAVWEITPVPGASGASYRAAVRLAAPDAPRPGGVRLSRYGASGSSCVRIDRRDGPVVYVTAQGAKRDRCP